MFALVVFSFFIAGSSNAIRVQTVSFSAEDSLTVTAEEYIIAPRNPYILLLHEQGSSRGDYNTIARRLCKMDYNCLALDLRNGGNNSFVSNETAKACREGGFETNMEQLEMDIEAAMEFIAKRTELPIILFGSGKNGSLGLKMAKEKENIRAAVVMSPGEYFLPELKIQDTIAGLKKPVFATSSKVEFPYVQELTSGIEEEYLTLFEPRQGPGERGTKSLSSSYEQNTEYWIALMLFFKELQ